MARHWWWPFGGGEGSEPPEQLPSVSEHTLADITRGMQHAVNSTQQLTEQHFIHMLERYLPEGKAIVQRIHLPDGQHVLDAPLIAMIPANGLQLKEMTVQMAVRIDHSVCKKAAPRGVETDLTRTSFEVSFAPRSGERGVHKKAASQGSAVDITMKFIADDPPEGVARVMEYFTNSLVPKALETDEPQSSGDPENRPEDGGSETPPDAPMEADRDAPAAPEAPEAPDDAEEPPVALEEPPEGDPPPDTDE